MYLYCLICAFLQLVSSDAGDYGLPDEEVDICGISQQQERGNQKGMISEWPWMAALVFKDGLRCGGVLITESHVLTAAHCVQGRIESELNVHFGANVFPDTLNDMPSAVKKIALSSNESHDIAILTLTEKVQMGIRVKPICLPSKDQPTQGLAGTILGWGQKYSGRPVSESLKRVTVDILNSNDCVKIYGEKFSQEINVCGERASGSDVCRADSGGPLMLKKPGGQWSVVGLVSWGTGCGPKGRPIVYTRVGSFVTWIKKQINSYQGDATTKKGKVRKAMRDICGVTVVKRILGGEEAAINEWTWVVALWSRLGRQCGGVLISDSHVLTAAHCVKGSNYFVRLRDNEKEDSTEVTANDFLVKSFKQHPDYRFIPGVNDIAILSLNKTVNFTESAIKPICLPSKYANHFGDSAVVVGWGRTARYGPASDTLKQVTLKIRENKYCKRIYGKKYSERNLCAGGDEGKDSCSGDSGGPLMVQDSRGKWTVAGIVNSGRGCGLKGFPGVYARVQEYIDWIEDNID